MINMILVKHNDYLNDYCDKEKILEKTIVEHLPLSLKNNIIDQLRVIDNHYTQNTLFNNQANIVVKVIGFVYNNDTSVDIVLSLRKLSITKKGEMSTQLLSYAYLKVLSEKVDYKKSHMYYKIIFEMSYSSKMFYHNEKNQHIVIECKKTLNYLLEEVERINDGIKKVVNFQEIYSQLINTLPYNDSYTLQEFSILFRNHRKSNITLEDMLLLPTLDTKIVSMMKDTHNPDKNKVAKSYDDALTLINTSYHNGLLHGNLTPNSVFVFDVFNPNPHYGDLIFDYAYYITIVLSNDYELDYEEFQVKAEGEIRFGVESIFRFTHFNEEEVIGIMKNRVLSWVSIIYTLAYSENDNYSHLGKYLEY